MIGIDGLGKSSVPSKSIQESGVTIAPAISSPPKAQESRIKAIIPPTQDQVTLSAQSKELSHNLQKNRPVEASSANDAQRYREPVSEKKTLSAVEIVKYFPPFLNSNRRQEIYEQYPEMRRQIEQMTVPRPIDFSAVNQTQQSSTDQDKQAAGI